MPRRAVTTSSKPRRRAPAARDPRHTTVWSPPPALALLELKSVARGIKVADAMVKRAVVSLMQAEPLTPGKFVIVIVGGEEEVDQSLRAGLELAGDTLIDRLFLAKVDPQLRQALAGQTEPGDLGALGIVETFSVAAAVLSADQAVKAAEVRLVQLRLARGLGGKAYYVLTGELHQVEAALEAGRGIIHDGMLLSTEIVARPHPDLLRTLLR